MTSAARFVERHELSFMSADGRLELYASDVGPRDAPLTVLCMAGLTRNSLDFAALARHLPRYRMISVDQRGRGRSQWDPEPANYTPLVQAGDMFVLLDKLGFNQQSGGPVLLGTSNGGLMAMIMGATQPARFRGIILNDVGPVIPIAGLKRIRDAFSALSPVTSWSEAAEQARLVNKVAFPDYTRPDWDAFARCTYLEDPSGTPVAAYDPAIIQLLNNLDFTVELPNLWSLWPALGKIPLLAIRGELSDLLSADLLDAMVARHSRAEALVIPNRGHAPTLTEPMAVFRIEQFLQRLEAAERI